MRYSLILLSVFVLQFGCKQEENTSLVPIQVKIEDAFYPEILAEVTVLDYHEAKELFLVGEYFSGNFYLINKKGEVQYTIEAPEPGSLEDYGRPSSAGFFDEESILILSQTKGISRIDFNGAMLEQYELPYTPAIFGGRLSKKARRLDQQSLVIQLEGRADFFEQVQQKYPEPLLEYWEPGSGTFSPIVTLPEASKYRQFNLINTPVFSYADGYLYLANQNEPVLFVYRKEGNSFLFDKAIPLQLPQFFEPKEDLLDEDDDFYEGDIYLLEVIGNWVYVFYQTGIPPEVYARYEEDQVWEMLGLEMKSGLALVNPETEDVRVTMLPDEVEWIEAAMGKGLFVGKQNIYVNATEDDTNKKLVISILPED